MNIRYLEYFVALAELQHFGRAAKHCSVSQPTLSGQIKKLEEELGAKLFERTNKTVMLTDIGESILHSAKRILAERDNLKEIAANATDPTTGYCRLGAIPTVASYIFPTLIPKLKKKMPNLKLVLGEYKNDDLIQKLKTG